MIEPEKVFYTRVIEDFVSFFNGVGHKYIRLMEYELELFY